MKKVLLIMALVCSLGFSQTITSNLSGKRIFMYRQDAGDHSDGYTGLRTVLLAGVATYGYTVEAPTTALANATAMDALFDRLYKAGVPRDTNTIDILIFCQGQGDRNVGGGTNGTTPFTGASARFGKVNNHVRNGGALVIVHAAAGREISWQNWIYGANLLADWFVDNYAASAAVTGNQGHFSAGTQGTLALDQETMENVDPSTYFIRKVMMLPADSNGYAKPESVATATGEWYHFNGGKRYEDGTGGNATHASNKVMPRKARGDVGIPDSGIGPLKVMAKLTRIQNSYIPPGGTGRPAIWGREVSVGAFDSSAHGTNGRFLFFSPGHQANEYTYGSGWLRSLLFSTLRWVVKDDRGCMNPLATNYDATATVNAGCPTGVRQDAALKSNGAFAGRISADASSITVDVQQQGAHTIRVTTMDGVTVLRQQGSGARQYSVKDLQSGIYMVRVNAGGVSHQKQVFLFH